MPLLFELAGTELHYVKLSVGINLAMKKGQIALSIPVNPSELRFIIKKLKEELDLMDAHMNDEGMDRRELRDMLKKRNHKD